MSIEDYKDIINLPRPTDHIRPPMSRYDRAAQFSPFAALTGYEDAVCETARLTDALTELGEDQIEKIDRALYYLTEHIDSTPAVELTYFVPDAKKEGGTFVQKTGKLKHIDTVFGILYFTDQTAVEICRITKLKPHHKTEEETP